MNKQDLIAKIAKDTGITKTNATAAVESFIDGITKSLKKGEPITFVGFGTFKTSQRKARTARNPQTGAAIKIPKRRVVRFTAGKALKDAVELTHEQGQSGRTCRPVPATSPFSLFRSPVSCYTDRSVRPVFSRHRRVAQWLERLLDTQEVGGSSPPVPTNLRSPLSERSFGWRATSNGCAAVAATADEADASERHPRNFR